MYDLEKIRPAWVEIDLDSLVHNIKEVKRLTQSPALVTAVVKADGYGHGAVKISQVLLDNGADRLAVAVLDEAIELRNAGYKVPILILGYTHPEQSSKIIDYNLEQTIYSLKAAKFLSQEAVKKNKIAKVHIKIDTGMRRIGMDTNIESIDTIVKISKLPGISIEGIFTHFAIADEKDKSFTEEQYKKFQWFCRELEKINVNIPVKHCANSAAIIELPEMHMDMVRAGIMLYSLTTTSEMLRQSEFKQVMSLKTRISHIKEIQSGESVGYGRTFIAEKPTRIASLPIGYADGYSRRLSGKAHVLVNGVRAPIVGRICMDQCMIDVTGIDNVSTGDEVVLFGCQRDNFISIDELAKTLDTINHEIVCAINRRVPRVYKRNGKIVDIMSYSPRFYTDSL